MGGGLVCKISRTPIMPNTDTAPRIPATTQSTNLHLLFCWPAAPPSRILWLIVTFRSHFALGLTDEKAQTAKFTATSRRTGSSYLTKQCSRHMILEYSQQGDSIPLPGSS